MRKRYVRRGLVIDEISGVDRAAQGPGGARVLLMKRDVGGDNEIQLVEKKAWLTTSMNGHCHLVDDLTYDGQRREAGETSFQRTTGEEYGHTHPWVRKVDGSIEIGEAEAHTHEILEQSITFVEKAAKKAEQVDEKSVEFGPGDYAYCPDREEPSTWKLRLTNSPGGKPDPGIVGAASAALGPGFRGQKVEIPEEDRPAVIARVRRAWLSANPDKDQEDLPEVLKMEDGSVDMKELQKQLATLADEKKDLEKRLARAEALAGLNDSEKACYSLLKSEDEKTAFLALKPEERGAAVKKAQSADESFTDSEGTEIRKSVVGDDLFKVLRKQQERLQEAEKRAADRDASLHTAELQKRAGEEIPNLPGDASVHVELLRAVDKIEDSTIRGKAAEILKGASNAMKELSKMRGRSSGDSGDQGDPSSKLEALAKRYADENKVTIVKARAAVLKTPEGRELYAQHDEEFSRRR